jgi:hypothetical protein
MLGVVSPLRERNTLAYHFEQHPSLPVEALNYKWKMFIEFVPDLFVQSIQQVWGIFKFDTPRALNCKWFYDRN